MGVPLLWGTELAFIAQPSVQKGGGGGEKGKETTVIQPNVGSCSDPAHNPGLLPLWSNWGNVFRSYVLWNLLGKQGPGVGGGETVKRTPNKIKDLTTPGTQIMVLVHSKCAKTIKSVKPYNQI